MTAGSFLEVLATLLLSVFGPALLNSLLRAREDKIASQIAMLGGAGSLCGMGKRRVGQALPQSPPGPGPTRPRSLGGTTKDG